MSFYIIFYSSIITYAYNKHFYFKITTLHRILFLLQWKQSKFVERLDLRKRKFDLQKGEYDLENDQFRKTCTKHISTISSLDYTTVY